MREMLLNLRPGQLWNGDTIRQQYKVIGWGGVCLAITARHHEHEFNLLEVYEI